MGMSTMSGPFARLSWRLVLLISSMSFTALRISLMSVMTSNSIRDSTKSMFLETVSCDWGVFLKSLAESVLASVLTVGLPSFAAGLLLVFLDDDRVFPLFPMVENLKLRKRKYLHLKFAQTN